MTTTANGPTGRQPRRALALRAGFLATILAAAGCGTPGKSSEPTSSAPVSTAVGTAPVTLQVTADVINTKMWKALGDAFKDKHPDITVAYRGEQFPVLQQNGPRLIAGSEAPDLIQFPTLGNSVKDHLLTNLDSYASAYGWTTFPQSQYASWRVSNDGAQRGAGSLYAVGIGYTLTGVYYNRAIAKKLGMTTPPGTLDEFNQLLAKSKSAGDIPMMAAGKDGAVIFPLQAVQMAYAGKQEVTDWVYDKEGANIDTPATVKAATVIKSWASNGYLPPDVNALDQTAAATAFTKGKGAFFYSGNWNAATLDKAMPNNVGFFLFPSLRAGAPHTAMSDPAAYVIPAHAKHPAAAAALLDFIQTDPAARQIVFANTGAVPGGSDKVGNPTAPPGSASGDTLAAFAMLTREDGIAAYMANATASIYTKTIIPQTQLLVAGRTTPEKFASKLQSDYKAQLGR